ncbi:response regulator receiver modulated diguanylate cyclase [Verrucomicrobium sp. GAS474]|uniref:GGDEF domain-containing response regulator n=1 Tax=Verrucomicrobium sp. GAS474 TaxID=1882831 RepID=UPI00087AF603|nr:GGDEF domain-containing response regulator [Verrucomicrobium sp. GAS474]SDT86891.1 response regulator receiver modulated diguanylate cyclase [Verrucomicrobium sp. GAS474]
MRILLIEDNRGDALLLEETLKETNLVFEIRQCEMLQDGIDLAQKESFDLVLLDLSLPDSSGAATVARAGKAFWKIPVVVLTSLDDDQMGLKALQFGAQDYLVKSQATAPLLLRAIRYAKERHRERETLLQASLIDPLTGLYNRRGFISVAGEELTARQGGEALVLFADLDGLKPINDTHGHAAGDWAIAHAGEALKGATSSDAIAARIGGDEFVVMILRAPEGTEEHLKVRIKEETARINAESGRPYRLSMSLGFHRPKPGEPIELDQLLNQADAALYEAKRARPR